MDDFFPTRRLSALFSIMIGTMAFVAHVPKMCAQAQLLSVNSTLPDAPSAVYEAAEDAGQQKQKGLPPCPPTPPSGSVPPAAATQSTIPTPPDCYAPDPLRIVVDSEVRQPLTSKQKAFLAVRDVIDPLNLVVIAGEAGIAVAVNSHTAYGPGFKGFGRLAGYDLVQDATGEFFGTYLIPSLTHEDPRYRRMEHAKVPRRILHALARTVIAQHDDGRYMPNYATLLTYPISAELSNLYVPGVQDNARSTVRRIAIGLATDPAGNLVAEFLPDLARRIHVRSIFIQQIVNQMASGEGFGSP